MRRVLFFMLALLPASKLAQGQAAGQPEGGARVIAGVTRDSGGRPVEGVEVRVGPRTVAITDVDGRFRVASPAGPVVSLTFRRLGYDPATRDVDVRTSGEAPLMVSLTSNAQLLNTVVVEGRAYDRELLKNGFYHRAKTASGSFFDSDFLAHFGGDGLGSVLHEVPRVEVMRTGDRDYAFSTVGGNRCRMNVYIDGMFQRVAMPGPGKNSDDALGLNDLIAYREIRAVEVYPRAMSVPTQFSRMGPGTGAQGRPMPRIPSPNSVFVSSPQDANADAACGAIVIWTKAPSDR